MDSVNTSTEYVTLFANSKNALSRQAIAYVKAQNRFVHVIDTNGQKLTALQLLELVTQCGIKLNQLFDRTTDFYRTKVHHTSNYSDQDLAETLAKNPDLMRTPFTIKGCKMKFYESVNDLG